MYDVHHQVGAHSRFFNQTRSSLPSGCPLPLSFLRFPWTMIMSFGSIATGLLVVRQQWQYTEEIVTYLGTYANPDRGIEMLAIIYSLPYGLLLWGMGCFSASVALTCFAVVGTIDARITRAVYAVIWGYVLALILMTGVMKLEGGLSGWFVGLTILIAHSLMRPLMNPFP